MSSFWKKIRADFPVAKRFTYLDHASGGPISRPVLAKIQEYYRDQTQKADLVWPKWIREKEAARRKVARFINADPEEITFIQSTSHGMNLIAELLSNQGAVLTNTSEFPSTTLPWIWRNANISFQREESGSVPLETLKRHLRPSIKTIVSSFVQYATGFRQDLESLGQLKKDRYLVVNATQGFGAFPIDVKKWNADFLCTNSYKWLMAGYGGGVLFIRKPLLQKFKAHSLGWRSMNDPERMDNHRIDIRPDAARYEYGCPSFPTIVAVGYAVEYLAGIGMKRVSKRILDLTDALITGLQALNCEIITPLEAKHRSGIVVFKAKTAENLRRFMFRHRIFVSARGQGIRVAPHCYNSFEEIDGFLKCLKQFCRRNKL